MKKHFSLCTLFILLSIPATGLPQSNVFPMPIQKHLNAFKQMLTKSNVSCKNFAKLNKNPANILDREEVIFKTYDSFAEATWSKIGAKLTFNKFWKVPNGWDEWRRFYEGEGGKVEALLKVGKIVSPNGKIEISASDGVPMYIKETDECFFVLEYHHPLNGEGVITKKKCFISGTGKFMYCYDPKTSKGDQTKTIKIHQRVGEGISEQRSPNLKHNQVPLKAGEA